MLGTLDIAGELRCALDPVAFAVERLGFEPDPWQAEVMRSPSKRILLNCSRQAGKSTCSAIIGLHVAIYYPRSLVLLVSPSLRQSRELFGKATEFLRRIEPAPKLDEDNKLSCTLANGSRLVSLPGTGETVRGYSAPDLIVEDEAAYVADSLYVAVRPMLAVSGGRLLLLSTPFGRRGHFYEAWEGEERWQRIEVPAEKCPRIDAEFLKSERQALGEWWYRQEYECNFVETLDQVFRLDDIRRSLSDDVKPLFADRPDPGVDEIKPLFAEAS